MKLKQAGSIGLGTFVLAVIVACQLISPNDTVFSQDPEALGIFKKIEKLAERTGSYHADVKTIIKKNGKIRVNTGKIKFKWPNMRWEEDRHKTKRGTRIGLSISNGKIRWNYIPSLKLAFKHDLQALGKDARQKGWATAGYLEKDTLQYLGK